MGDRGVQAVGADDRVRFEQAWQAAIGDDSSHPSMVISDQILDPDAVLDLRTTCHSGIDQRTIQYPATRRVQRADAVARLDSNGNVLTGVAERCRAHGRGASRLDRRQHIPALQLQDGAAHQCVRGQRVAAVGPFVDEQHASASSRQQESGRRTCAPCPDDHDIKFLHRGHRPPLPPKPPPVSRISTAWGRASKSAKMPPAAVT